MWCGVGGFDLSTTVLQKRGRGRRVELESESQLKNFLESESVRILSIRLHTPGRTAASTLWVTRPRIPSLAPHNSHIW